MDHEVSPEIGNRTKTDIVTDIKKRVPIGSERPTDPMVLGSLTKLTNELIDASGGKETVARTDPYAEVLSRELPLEEGIAEKLAGKKILITGGEGLVGQELIKKLHKDFQPGSITSIDIAGQKDLYGQTDEDGSVDYLNADVRDPQALQKVFEEVKPDIVFHLAAISEVGQGEEQKVATIDTNVFGTKNLIEISEKSGVQDFVYSSTGKAAQYVTHGVFGTTVKIIEAELASAAQKEDANVRYGMARFTHVVENSNLVADIKKGIENGIVFLHTDDRYFYAQGVDEAVGSLLNSMMVSEKGKLTFGSVRDIGWPVNNLDIALHQIAKSGRDVPIYFSGVEKGYDPETFKGQCDPEAGTPALVNVLETQNMELTQTGGTIIAEMAPFSVSEFQNNLAGLESSLHSSDPDLSKKLSEVAESLTKSELENTDPTVVAKILRWGIGSEDLEIHQDTLKLLLDRLATVPQNELQGIFEQRVFGGAPLDVLKTKLEKVMPDDDIPQFFEKDKQ